MKLVCQTCLARPFRITVAATCHISSTSCVIASCSAVDRPNAGKLMSISKIVSRCSRGGLELREAPRRSAEMFVPGARQAGHQNEPTALHGSPPQESPAADAAQESRCLPSSTRFEHQTDRDVRGPASRESLVRTQVHQQSTYLHQRPQAGGRCPCNVT